MGKRLNIIKLEEISSTNSYALDVVKTERVPEGTVIWAMNQTGGLGQGERRWISEPGKNLTFSVIVYPGFLKPEKQFYLNMAVSLGILDFSGRYLGLKNIFLKWPNDLYFENKKLGGLLINNIITGNKFDCCIIGLGINVNQTLFGIDIPNPVSFRIITGKEYDLEDSLNELIVSMKDRYELLKLERFSDLEADYLKRLMGYEQWRYYTYDGGIIRGRIKGVKGSGELILQLENSEQVIAGDHDIEFIL